MVDHSETAARVNDLYAKVTEAIFRAERLPDDAPEAESAYHVVSTIEQDIARLLPADILEGALARVGAVTASIDAKDWLRAEYLIDCYRVDAPDDLVETLGRLAEEVEELRVASTSTETLVRPVRVAVRPARQ